MKYVVMIHSHPEPWGHPTIDFTPEGRAVPKAERQAMEKEFDEFLEALSKRGELVFADALAAPEQSTVLRWDGDKPVASQGPFAESVEHLAGFFVIDVESRERAEEIARRFASAGDVVELRPSYSWPEE